jgi:hypothetical protein
MRGESQSIDHHFVLHTYIQTGLDWPAQLSFTASVVAVYGCRPEVRSCVACRCARIPCYLQRVFICVLYKDDVIVF